MSKPRFNGWRPLLGEEKVKPGDVFIRITPPNPHEEDRRTPETGDIAGDWAFGRKANFWANSGRWWAYRNEHEGPSLPRRILSSAYYCKPLPLP